MNDLAVSYARFMFTFLCLHVFFLVQNVARLLFRRLAGIIETDLGYLCDFPWICGTGLQHLNLLVRVGGVHPLGLIRAPICPSHLS